MHCGAINESSGGRSSVSVDLPRELDQRFTIAPRQINPHKTTPAHRPLARAAITHHSRRVSNCLTCAVYAGLSGWPWAPFAPFAPFAPSARGSAAKHERAS